MSASVTEYKFDTVRVSFCAVKMYTDGEFGVWSRLYRGQSARWSAVFAQQHVGNGNTSAQHTWPCPSVRVDSRSAAPCSAARRASAAPGSPPGESSSSRGAVGGSSASASLMSAFGGSAYLAPRTSATHAAAARGRRSGLRTRIMM